MITITPQTPLGWIGTGVMGGPMCGHLLARGYRVTVYNRTRAKAEPLLSRGAVWVDSPREVAERSVVTFAIVGFPQDVREVFLGPQGLLQGARPGSVLIDMTTSPPSLAEEIAAAAAARGAHALDAPVTGGDVGAREARLSIMVGGDRAVFEAVRPLLEIMGRTVVYHGPAGAGQHAKVCNQIAIAGMMIGVCESLLYGLRAGLELEQVVQSIRGGAAASWALDNLAPRILGGDFEPGFFVEHFVKDMAIALDEARRMNLALPGLALVHQLYTALIAQGKGKRGTHALYLALKQLSGIP